MPAETHVRGRGGGDTRSVAEVVLGVVAEVTGCEPAELSTDDPLVERGVTGLVLIDVIEAVEEELGDRTVGIEVDDEELGSAATVGDLVDLIAEGLGAGR